MIDPNLQIALDWQDQHQHRSRDAWAARYGGDFALAMKFLDASRDQREARRAAARALQRQKLRRAWITAGVSVLALAFTLLLAAWAWIHWTTPYPPDVATPATCWPALWICGSAPRRGGPDLPRRRCHPAGVG